MDRTLFEFENYREYLRYRLGTKVGERGTSLRSFARRAGIASAGFLQYVLNGKRNLSSASIAKFVRALKLNREEAEFFENLVFFNQARTSEDKKIYWERMIRSRLYRQLRSINQKEYEFYSHWYCTAIRELVNVPMFQEDPAWIAHTLQPPISITEAGKALQLLLDLGLLRRESDGKLVQADPSITTGPEVRSLAIVNFHKEMIQLGMDSLDRISPKERDISALTVGIFENQIESMRDMVRHFRQELAKKFGHNSATDRVYQLNIQLFPLNKNGKEG